MNFGTFGIPQNLGLNSSLFGLPSTNKLWTPSLITTQLWLDALDSTTITTVSGGISEWKDKSGNNRNALQTNSSNRPTLIGLNSLPYINFNNSHWLVSSYNFNYQSYFIIFISSNTINSFDGYLAIRAASSSLVANSITSQNLLLNHWDTTSDVFDNSSSSTNLTYFNGSFINISSKATPFSGNHRFVNSTAFNANFLYQEYEINSGSGLKNLVIGADSFTGGGNRYLVGQIGEIIIFDCVLYLNDRQKIEGYLAHKWGISNKLPLDHPYKVNPPKY